MIQLLASRIKIISNTFLSYIRPYMASNKHLLLCIRNSAISYLVSGFINTTTNASLFVYTSGTDIIYFLVHVDDLILIRNNDQLLSTFLGKLSATFSLKDLGPLSYFIGVEVINVTNRLFLASKSILDMLENFELQNVKSTTTPIANSIVLKLDDGMALVDATKYWKIIGSLQYLSMSRPDINFSIISSLTH